MNYKRLETPPITKVTEVNSNHPRSGMELEKAIITLGQESYWSVLQSPLIKKGTKENYHRPRSEKELKEIAITLGQERSKRNYNHPRSGK
jgi:hypothetical protein